MKANAFAAIHKFLMDNGAAAHPRDASSWRDVHSCACPMSPSDVCFDESGFLLGRDGLKNKVPSRKNTVAARLGGPKRPAVHTTS